MTRVFVLNCGSSSIKWAVVDPVSGDRLRSGIVDRIGVSPSDPPDHRHALRSILDELGDLRVDAIGHRVVHGGIDFDGPTVVTDEVEELIMGLSALAPLHNPPSLAGIVAAREWFPGITQVAVFDTAFHRSLPPHAYTYALDRTMAKAQGIRRFGFHGISFQYVSRAAAAELGRPLESLKMIVFHLGNGASVCAIDGGRSIDTSMGMTPTEGLVMGTRTGDIDPGALVHLLRAGVTPDELDHLLNRTGGLTGMAGTADYRDVEAAASLGDADAVLALAVMHHRLRHYLGAYLAILGGADAIVFTGGIGEHSATTRERALAGLDALGIQVDKERNASHLSVISTPTSAVTVMVIPTNEEGEIARQVTALLRR